MHGARVDKLDGKDIVSKLQHHCVSVKHLNYENEGK